MVIQNKSSESSCCATEISWRCDLVRFALEALVPPSLHYLKGHFVDNPIVPGFVTTSWMLAAAQRFFAQSFLAKNDPQNVPSCKRIVGLKFLRPLQPGDRFTLQGALTSERALDLECVLPQGELIASGKFLYG